MRLILTRSQRDKGIVSKHALFCLNARVELTEQEGQAVRRYKLGALNIYRSPAAEAAAKLSAAAPSGYKALMHAVSSRLALNISINNLLSGQYIECKEMDELLAAEEAIGEACANLRRYIDTAATFDGRQVLINYDSEEPVIIGQTAPQQIAHQPSQPATYTESYTATPQELHEPEPERPLTVHPMAQKYVDDEDQSQPSYELSQEYQPSERSYSDTGGGVSDWLQNNQVLALSLVGALIVAFLVTMAVMLSQKKEPELSDAEIMKMPLPVTDVSLADGKAYFVNGAWEFDYTRRDGSIQAPCDNPRMIAFKLYRCD